MNVLDLFSGIGGFSLGLERAGMRTVAFCEIDPYCRAVLRKHWPDVPCYDDIRTLSRTRLAADGVIEDVADAEIKRVVSGNRSGSGLRGSRVQAADYPQREDERTQHVRHDADDSGHSIDLICGGFPCQDISAAGKGAGITGERSGLWKEYARLIGEIRPRFVVVENVAALLGRGLSTVLGDLAALGFDAEWHCIPAAAVGAPHRRDRVWIVAHAVGRGRGQDWQCGGVEGMVGHGPHDAGAATQSSALADADEPRLAQRIMLRGIPGDAECSGARQDTGLDGEYPTHHTSIGEGIRRGDTAGQWWTEPDVRRVFDGISKGLDGGLNAGNGMDSMGSAAEMAEAELRSVWRDIAARAASQGSQPDEQLAGELANRLPDMSHTIALGRGQDSLAAALRYLHRLRQACETLGVVRDASQPTVEAWLALSDQEAERAFLAACGRADWGSGEWLGVGRVAHGVSKRVDRLRSLGNAVVPQIPEIIGRAIMRAA